MLGDSIFPPVGQLPYLLTLPPYGFYWFELSTEGALPAWHIPSPEPLPELRTQVFKAPLAEMLQGALRSDLEQVELKEYLVKRRWFSAKNQRLQEARLTMIAPLPDTGGRVVMAEVEALLDGRTEHFSLPLATVEEGQAVTPLPAQLALARFRRGRQVGFITDGFASDDFAHAVLAAVQAATTIDSDGGTATDTDAGNHAQLRFMPAPSLSQTPLLSTEIRRFSADQSNSSLVIGDTVVVKLLRRLTPGIHPEVEMTRYLTEAGITSIAPLLGHVERTVTGAVDGVGADHATVTTLIVQGFVRNQGDAWGWTLDWLHRALSEVATDHAGSDDPFAGYHSFAAAIGRRLGEIHAGLALPNDDPAFSPEPATSRDVAEWARSAVADLTAVLDALAGRDSWDNAETEMLVQSLIELRSPLLEAVQHLGSSKGAVLRTRVHGDFHLGQVLVAQGDAVIVDFEGEPARSLAERRAKTSPAKDVAGLLRSLDYAAAMLSAEAPQVDTPLLERRRITLDLWRQDASTAFLDAYNDVAQVQPRPWLRPSEEQDIIDIFMLEKVAYEINYEIANRPSWLHIPLHGLERLARRLVA